MFYGLVVVGHCVPIKQVEGELPSEQSEVGIPRADQSRRRGAQNGRLVGQICKVADYYCSSVHCTMATDQSLKD